MNIMLTSEKSRIMNKILKHLLIFIALLTIQGIMTLNAQDVQTITVTGQVVDESGNPLAGVTVKSFNLKNSVLTNSNGEFSIKEV